MEWRRESPAHGSHKTSAYENQPDFILAFYPQIKMTAKRQEDLANGSP